MGDGVRVRRRMRDQQWLRLGPRRVGVVVDAVGAHHVVQGYPHRVRGRERHGVGLGGAVGVAQVLEVHGGGLRHLLAGELYVLLPGLAAGLHVRGRQVHGDEARVDRVLLHLVLAAHTPRHVEGLPLVDSLHLLHVHERCLGHVHWKAKTTDG